MVKTLTIMDDAYELLRQQKEKNESFSGVIRRLCTSQRFDIRPYIGILPMNKERAEAFHKSVKEGRKCTAEDRKREGHVKKIWDR